MNKGLFPPFY